MSMPQGSQGLQAPQTTSAGVSGLCPLCKQRPADTTVYYDEVLSTRTTASRLSRYRTRYARSALSSHGNMQLCAPCAARYEDSIASRTLGHRLLNWGTALLLGGCLLFLFMYASVRGSLLELVTSLPVLIGIVLIGSGAGLLIAGNRQKQPVVRYLRERLK